MCVERWTQESKEIVRNLLKLWRRAPDRPAALKFPKMIGIPNLSKPIPYRCPFCSTDPPGVTRSRFQVLPIPPLASYQSACRLFGPV